MANKANPYHDDAGRFTVGPNSGGARAPDGTTVDPAAKTPTPTLLPPRPASDYKKKRPGLTEKEAASDRPSWVTDGPLRGETVDAFALRKLDEKYPDMKGKHDLGATSEFSQIKKWAERAFEN